MIQGIGIDIVEIEKLRGAIKRGKERFIRRVFTDLEIEYCNKKGPRCQHFAVRFAAKEAFMKALGTGWQNGVKWRDIETLNDRLGKPNLNLSGKAKELASKMKIKKTYVSLSHSENHAIAQVILVGHSGL